MTQRLLFVFVMSVFVLSCMSEPGSFTITFQWDHPPAESVWIWVQVQERIEHEKEGTIMASAGPAEYSSADGVRLEMPAVPNGDNLVVVVEVREGPSSTLPVLYYGLSAPFEVASGKTSEVGVYLELQKSQAEQQEATVSLMFNGEEKTTIGSADLINATLITETTGASTVVVANDASFAASLTSYSLVSGDGIDCTVEGDWDRCEITGWDLTAGLTDSSDGQYTVYLKFADRFGYETQVYKVSTVLDSQPPQALVASLSNTTAGLGTEVYLTVTFHEEIADNAILTIAPASGAPVFMGPERVGASTSYLWSALIDEDVTPGKEPFTFSVETEDMLGNATSSEKLSDGTGEPVTLTVDNTPPALDAPASITLSLLVAGLNSQGEKLEFDFTITELNPLGLEGDGSCGPLCPKVRLDNALKGGVTRAKSLDSATENRLGFHYSYTIDKDDWGPISKTLPIVISWADGAGNTLEEELPVGPTFDFIRPSASFCSLSPGIGNAATVFTYTMTADEPLGDAPVLSIQSKNESLFSAEPDTSGDGLSFTWSQAAQGLESETFTISATLTDLAGNASDGMECEESSLVDGSAPGIGGEVVTTVPEVVSQSAGTILAVGNEATIIASFQVAEDMDLAVGSPEVKLGVPGKDFPFEKQSATQDNGLWHYEYALTIDEDAFIDSEGFWPVRVVISDVAGNLMTNENLGGKPVQIDLTPPLASCNLVPEPAAGSYGQGSVPTLQVSPLEELEPGFTPVIIEEFTPPLESPLFAWLEETTYTFIGPIDDGIGESDFTLRVRLRDLVGNETPGDGTACVSGLVSGAVDGLAPVVKSVSVSAFDGDDMAPPGAVLKAGLKVTAMVEVEGTEMNPAVMLGDVSMQVVGPGAPNPDSGTVTFEYQRILDGTEGKGLQPIAIDGTDSAGNMYSHYLANAVELDFVPPYVLNANLFLTAPADSVVKQVTAATNDTTLQLILTANEPLQAPPIVEASNETRSIAWGEPVTSNVVTGTYTWSLVLVDIGLEDDWQGEFEVSAHLVDLAGNEDTMTLALTTPLMVDSIPPPALDDSFQRGLRLYRNPHGTAETGMVALTEVRGCGIPGQKWNWCPPTDHFSPVESGSTVTLYEMTGEGEEGCSNLILAMQTLSDADEGFTMSINGDRPGVCLSRTDAAGNSSLRRQVRYVEWVGSFNNAGQGNPHSLYSFSSFTPDEWPRLGRDLLTPIADETTAGLAASGDSQLAVNSALPGWRDISRGIHRPRFEVTMSAFDAWRGSAIFFGGSLGGWLSNETFEWTGFKWIKHDPPHAPSPRFGGSMAFDAVRGRIVLFGGEAFDGQGMKYNDETWEWDGTDWSQRAPEHVPPAATGHNLAFNPLTGRVMMTGGVQDGPPMTQTWEWTGDDWNLLWQAESGWDWQSQVWLLYLPQLESMVAYADTAQGTSFMRWTGSDWELLELSTGPSASNCSVIFDPAAGKHLLVEQEGIWELEDGGLVKKSEMNIPDFVLGTTPFTDYAMGEAGIFYNENQIAIRSNGQWQKAASEDHPRHPSDLYGSQLFFDPVAGHLRLLCEPCMGDHTWSGRFWHKEGEYNPWDPAYPGMYGQGGVIYDHGTEALVAFGYGSGETGHMWHTWVHEADNNQWAYSPGPTQEPASEFSIYRGFASHAASQQVIYMEPQFRQWVWTGVDDQWQFSVPAYGPVAGYGTAYDSLRERVVANAHQMGTWFWDGRDWTWTYDPDLAETSDYLPNIGQMTYDEARDRVVFHSMDAGMPTGTWEHDGEIWSHAELSSDLAPQYAYLTYHPLSSTTVALGLAGVSPDDGEGNTFMETWTYSPAQSRPHLIAAFDLEASSTVISTASDPESKHLLKIELSVTAGGASHTMGSGHFDGKEVPGVEFKVFTSNLAPWVTLGRLESGTPWCLGTMKTSFDEAWRCEDGVFCPASSINRWIAPDGKLYLDATTLEAHGASAARAEVALDHLEIRLVYQRGEATPQEDGWPVWEQRCDGLLVQEYSSELAGKWLDVMDCNDGNPCTEDVCAPFTGCSHSAPVSLCEMGTTSCQGRLLSYCIDGGTGCGTWDDGAECPANSICESEEGGASCQCLHLACDNECCPSPSLDVEYICFQGDCCAAQCDLTSCGGDDLCGGQCGCSDGMECVNGNCEDMDCSPFKQETCPVGTWCSAVDGKCHAQECDEEMCIVPQGPFWRGCNPLFDELCASSDWAMYDQPTERPNVWVSVNGFRMDRFEVSVTRYKECYDAGLCEKPFGGWSPADGYTWGYVGTEEHPVNGINWHAAQDFCAFDGKRLCTEAEWEKAARGADGRTYPWGHHCPPLEWEVSCNPLDSPITWEMEIGTVPVGQHPEGRSAYGLHNMGGNVSEWVSDIFEVYYGFSPDSLDNPTGPVPKPDGIEELHTIRGGSTYEWWEGSDPMRTTYRTAQFPNYSYYTIGIRCCQDLP